MRNAVQLQRHSALTCRTAGLPSPSPSVGRLCARDHELSVNSSLKEFTVYATIRRDCPTGSSGVGGLVTLVSHSVHYRVPDGNILMTTRRKFYQSKPTSGEGGDNITFHQRVYPPCFLLLPELCPRF